MKNKIDDDNDDNNDDDSDLNEIDKLFSKVLGNKITKNNTIYVNTELHFDNFLEDYKKYDLEKECPLFKEIYKFGNLYRSTQKGLILDEKLFKIYTNYVILLLVDKL